jgi:hypothetical protein
MLSDGASVGVVLFVFASSIKTLRKQRDEGGVAD